MKAIILGLTLLASTHVLADSETENYYDYCVDELAKNEASRQEILAMQDTSEGAKAILLQINENAKKSIQITMSVVCK